MNTHPSFLALDRAQLGVAAPEVMVHLSSCEHCQSYLSSLSPASASGFAEVRERIDAQGRTPFKWLWGFSAALAAATCLVLFLRSGAQIEAPRIETGSTVQTEAQNPSVGTTHDQATYLGAKGFRSVWVYVKRGTETRLWDGKQSVVPGDRVRLKLDPGAYHRVQVYSLSDPAEPVLLFSGPLSPGQILTLPDAWEIDDSATAERLFVVFSDVPVQPEWDAWLQGKTPPEVAVLPIVLPKTQP